MSLFAILVSIIFLVFVSVLFLLPGRETQTQAKLSSPGGKVK